MEQVKIIALADSLAVVLPETVVKRLQLEVGDTLEIRQVQEAIELRPDQYTLELRAARRVMQENRDVLKRLSES